MLCVPVLDRLRIVDKALYVLFALQALLCSFGAVMNYFWMVRCCFCPLCFPVAPCLVLCVAPDGALSAPSSNRVGDLFVHAIHTPS